MFTKRKDPRPADPPALFAARPWQFVSVPQQAMRVRTMLSEDEGQFLFWLTSTYCQGLGAVCDLGCFAGGSTARLAAGVADAGLNVPVHGFDHFTIQDAQKEEYLYPSGVPEFQGEDMEQSVRALLHPWVDFTYLHRGDICRTDWRGGPIEVLFIDAGKTPAAADQIAEIFMPDLIPGRSIVVQQDYQHARQPWIPVQMELLAECFEPVAWCDEGTVAFLTRQVPTRRTLRRAAVAGLSDNAMIAELKRAMIRLPDRRQKAQIARAIMGLQDNPGARRPQAISPAGFTQARVQNLISETSDAA